MHAHKSTSRKVISNLLLFFMFACGITAGYVAYGLVFPQVKVKEVHIDPSNFTPVPVQTPASSTPTWEA